MKNEAHARIKINQMLEESGWRFFDDEKGPANILLENHVKITQVEVDAWGNDYEKTKSGSLDILLIDSNKKPVCVLEAKRESLNPLVAKEQARKYAKTVGAGFIILSNGIVHYLWNLKKGNPKPIYKFPSAYEIGAIREWNPDRNSLADEPIKNDYIAIVQMPDYAQRDPITNEIGKTIIFAVSQNHARKITEILNNMAEQLYPDKYNSDFALQVTSQVDDAQQMTINFSNNKLSGKTNWLEGYKSGKTRVCVTVGMMTTGYDCPDLLNLCMMRPIFSPADFVQVKGRGTRKHTFEFKHKNQLGEQEVVQYEKKLFKLFDFFANCEYFEEKFDYDEKFKLPKPQSGDGEVGGSVVNIDKYNSFLPDPLALLKEQQIGYEGMKIDRMLFRKFEDRVVMDDIIKKNVELGNWEYVVSHIQNEIFDKPEEYFNLEKLRKAAGIDRKISIREVVPEYIKDYINLEHFAA